MESKRDSESAERPSDQSLDTERGSGSSFDDDEAIQELSFLPPKEAHEQSSIPQPVHKETLVGTVIADEFAVLDCIGEGELCVVCIAMSGSDDVFALKTIKSRDPKLMDRFKDAIMRQGKLNHSNIVKSHSYIENRLKEPFYIMEVIEGVTLAETLKTLSYIESEEIIALTLIQVASALEYAHQNSIKHGHLTPRDIFLIDKDEAIEVKVTDFGISDLKERSWSSLDKEYFSPECLDGSPATVASDIYSLGVIAFKMTTGHFPFDENQILNRAFEAGPSSLSTLRPDLRAVHILEQLLSEALDANPEWRLESATQFKQGLSDWLEAASKAPEIRIQESPSEVPSNESPAQIPRQQLPAQTPYQQLPAQNTPPQEIPAQTPHQESPAQIPRQESPTEAPAPAELALEGTIHELSSGPQLIDAAGALPENSRPTLPENPRPQRSSARQNVKTTISALQQIKPTDATEATQKDQKSEGKKRRKRSHRKKFVTSTFSELLSLKHNISQQDQTMVMRFTNAAAKGHQRRSPLATVLRIMAAVIIGGSIGISAAIYAYTHPEEIAEAYRNSSMYISAILSREQPPDFNQEMTSQIIEAPPVAVQPKAKPNGKSKTAVTPPTGAPPTGGNSNPSPESIRRVPRFSYSESNQYKMWTVDKFIGQSRRLEKNKN